MNRNNERHFKQIPEMHASRTRFNRDQTILTTFDSGKLIPFYVDEVLPGDTFQVNTSAIIRMTTPKYPVMDDSFIDFYYFYCPNRIIWDNFKRFMGEADETPWKPSKTYKVPKIKIQGVTKENYGPQEASILDYMGVPTKIVTSNTSENPVEVNALPVRAYVKIWNEFFRDQNVGNPAFLQTGDNDIFYTDYGNKTTTSETLNMAYGGARCLPVNKFHDYFTSCLPYPQRGPEVTVPTEGMAQVKWGLKTQDMIDAFGSDAPGGNFVKVGTGQAYFNKNTTPETEYPGFRVGTESGGVTTMAGTFADLSTATAATINQLRQAFAVQQYYEALARGGSRYREQVRALFNVEISDKTVQIPEYLGGGRYHVNMNQIVQTSGQQSDTDTPIGETGAMSVTPINEASFTKSFEEHGFVIGVMCVRHNHSYQQGLERFWSRSDRLDYYFPQFANLGEQPVLRKEIYCTDDKANNDIVFGYQEAWADYRMKPNRVSGKMRSNAEGTLDFWHYADNYSSAPTLSQEWMAEGKTEIARTLIVQDEPQFFGAIRVANKTVRRMPLYSVPGLNKL